MEKKLLRISEAAIVAGCSRSTAYVLAANGTWPVIETPYGRRVVAEGLDKWIEDQVREQVR